METYLVIGFIMGLIFVGVYMALPHEEGETMGAVALRVILILVSALFLWPLQLAFYATLWIRKKS